MAEINFNERVLSQQRYNEQSTNVANNTTTMSQESSTTWEMSRLQKMSIAPFLKSLYTILSTEDPSVIGWTSDGRGFEVRNLDVLSNEILPKYFRHDKFSSFQRQLNYFGFKKLTKSHANVCTYLRDHFVRGDPSGMFLIKRKTHGQKSKAAAAENNHSQAFADQKQQMHHHHQHMSSLNNFHHLNGQHNVAASYAAAANSSNQAKSGQQQSNSNNGNYYLKSNPAEAAAEYYRQHAAAINYNNAHRHQQRSGGGVPSQQLWDPATAYITQYQQHLMSYDPSYLYNAQHHNKGTTSATNSNPGSHYNSDNEGPPPSQSRPESSCGPKSTTNLEQNNCNNSTSSNNNNSSINIGLPHELNETSNSLPTSFRELSNSDLTALRDAVSMICSDNSPYSEDDVAICEPLGPTASPTGNDENCSVVPENVIDDIEDAPEENQ